MAHLNISSISSASGDHNDAIRSLENIWQIIRLVANDNPHYFYVYHNELAFELGEVAEISEAKALSAIALSWRFAYVYPEWTATRDRLEAKSLRPRRSVVVMASGRSDSIPAEPVQHRRRAAQPRLTPNQTCSVILGIPEPTTARSTIGRDTFLLLNLVSFTLDRLGESIQPRAPPQP
jgi:hypothetical protein